MGFFLMILGAGAVVFIIVNGRLYMQMQEERREFREKFVT